MPGGTQEENPQRQQSKSKGKGKATGVDDVTDKMDKLSTTRALDLSKHPVPEALKLPPLHQFIDVDELRLALNGSDGPLLFHSLVRMVEYATRKKSVAGREMHQIWATLENEMEETNQHFIDTQDELQMQLDVANRQLTSTSIDDRVRAELQQERERHLEMGDKLAERTKQCIKLQVELEEARASGPSTGSMVASVTRDYRPRGGIGPKHQLSGKDVDAYAPWKAAIESTLRTDAVMYPTGYGRRTS